MKIRILIATSEGPSEIQSLVREDSGVASAVCLNGSTKALPITRGYHAFVQKPTGVVERMTGHKSWRMDVSEPITNGESWQLGAYLAHALLQRDALATQGEAADAVWLVTGAVNIRDETVNSVSHLQQKLDQAADLLAQAKSMGTQAAFVFPAVDLPQLQHNHRIPILPVDTAADMLANLANAGNLGRLKKLPRPGVKAIVRALVAMAAFMGRVSSKLAKAAWLKKLKQVPRPRWKTIAKTCAATVAVGALAVGGLYIHHEGYLEMIFADTGRHVSSEKVVSVDLDKAFADENPQAEVLQAERWKGELSFRLYALKTTDGGPCLGRRDRDVRLKVEEIQAAFERPWQDGPDICGLRFQIKPWSPSQFSDFVSISIASNPPHFFRKDARRTDGIEFWMQLRDKKVYENETGLAPSRSGNYTLSITLENSSEKLPLGDKNIMVKKTSVIGWVDENIKDQKQTYQSQDIANKNPQPENDAGLQLSSEQVVAVDLDKAPIKDAEQNSQDIAAKTLQPERLKDQLSFQLFAMKTTDDGPCAGRQYRDVALKLQQIESAFERPWQDSPNICGLRFQIENPGKFDPRAYVYRAHNIPTKGDYWRISISIASNPPHFFRKDGIVRYKIQMGYGGYSQSDNRKEVPISNGKLVTDWASLMKGEAHIYEMGLSLFRSGNYTLTIAVEDKEDKAILLDKNIVVKKTSVIGWEG